MINSDEPQFQYLDKKEAAFLLGIVKHVDCFNCPDFYLGCEGNLSPAQLGNITAKEYLYTQKKGTETYLCGKLRNIVIADDMKLLEIEKSFDITIKQNIAYLNKLVDKCVLKTANYDLEVRNVEHLLQKKLDSILEEHTKHIINLQNLLNETENKLYEKESELQIEKSKNKTNQQYATKMHSVIENLQRTIHEQNISNPFDRENSIQSY